MSFLKKLFGGGSNEGGGSSVARRETYKDFIIEADPMPEGGGQYRLRAYILQSEEPDAPRETVIRADLFTSADQAAEFAVMKARQVIDEQGSFLFRSDG